MSWNFHQLEEENAEWVRDRFANSIRMSEEDLVDLTSGDLVGDDLADTGTVLRELSHAYGVRGVSRCMAGDSSGSEDLEVCVNAGLVAVRCFVQHYKCSKAGSFSRPVATADEVSLILSAFISFGDVGGLIGEVGEWVDSGLIDGLSSSALFSLIGNYSGVFSGWLASEVDADHAYRQIIDGGLDDRSAFGLMSHYHKGRSDDPDDSGFPEFIASPWRECPVEILAYFRCKSVVPEFTPSDLCDPVWADVRFAGLMPDWLSKIQAKLL